MEILISPWRDGGATALQKSAAAATAAGNAALALGESAKLDVALTTLLLAGGADGMHSIVSAVTSFFDASSTKSSGS